MPAESNLTYQATPMESFSNNFHFSINRVSLRDKFYYNYYARLKINCATHGFSIEIKPLKKSCANRRIISIKTPKEHPVCSNNY